MIALTTDLGMNPDLLVALILFLLAGGALVVGWYANWRDERADAQVEAHDQALVLAESSHVAPRVPVQRSTNGEDVLDAEDSWCFTCGRGRVVIGGDTEPERFCAYCGARP